MQDMYIITRCNIEFWRRIEGTARYAGLHSCIARYSAEMGGFVVKIIGTDEANEAFLKNLPVQKTGYGSRGGELERQWNDLASAGTTNSWINPENRDGPC